jgi:hypothetical protein
MIDKTHFYVREEKHIKHFGRDPRNKHKYDQQRKTTYDNKEKHLTTAPPH